MGKRIEAVKQHAKLLKTAMEDAAAVRIFVINW